VRGTRGSVGCDPLHLLAPQSLSLRGIHLTFGDVAKLCEALVSIAYAPVPKLRNPRPGSAASQRKTPEVDLRGDGLEATWAHAWDGRKSPARPGSAGLSSLSLCTWCHLQRRPYCLHAFP
jgi:hypothetical protein